MTRGCKARFLRGLSKVGGSNSQILQETSQQPILQHWDEDANISRNEIMFHTSCKPPISTNRKNSGCQQKDLKVRWDGFPFLELGNTLLRPASPDTRRTKGENLDASELMSNVVYLQVQMTMRVTLRLHQAFKKTQKWYKLYPTHPEERHNLAIVCECWRRWQNLYWEPKQMDDESAAFI